MLRTPKPKNARAKRALEAREPKEIEDPRTAIFVKGTHTGETLNGLFKDLMALKRPNAISFAKKNLVRPFEDVASLEFWAHKNDASFFIVGQSTKKRPDNLTLVRTFDGKVLDMCEVGVENYIEMAKFKTPKSTPGHKPLMHFASPLFDTHPRLIQLKSLLISLFNGEQIDAIFLKGIEHVISISLGPAPASLTADSTNSADMPKIHIRTYTINLHPSGVRIPRISLTPMGPFFDLTLRRNQEADATLMAQALKKPKVAKNDIEKGLGKRKKNIEVDDMGNMRGRIHVGAQDLSGLKGKKMKALRPGKDEFSMDVDDEEVEDAEQPQKKKQRM